MRAGGEGRQGEPVLDRFVICARPNRNGLRSQPVPSE